ncbi:MAG: hypothetical protein QOH22_498, partial [Gemmatimonadaceae bacterium]|nr:hypothetical protein [Gemmatimonadaceae bacterium]
IVPVEVAGGPPSRGRPPTSSPLPRATGADIVCALARTFSIATLAESMNATYPSSVRRSQSKGIFGADVMPLGPSQST